MKTHVLNFGKMMIFGLLLILSVQPIFASADHKEKEDIPIEGEWKEGERSTNENCPIAASFDASYLYLENHSERSNIIVRVKNNGVTLIEETVSANTPSFMIPIGSLQENSLYIIEVTNQWGDLLVGAFTF